MADSVTAVLNNYDVYEGVWTNWAKGSVRGATVTTTTKHGALLIAFLALYVQIVGTRFWRILCFLFHQSLSGHSQDDGFYHQRQAALRNVATDYSSFFELARVGWAWRNKTRRPLGRVIPLCLAALTHIACFTVAGVFSSYVTDAAGNEVLLSSANGGFLNVTARLQYDATYELETAIPYSIELSQASSAYAQQCFNDGASAQACETYVKPKFDSTLSNISCPFGGDICLDGAAIRLDSGPLDSQLDFGINARPEERFTWRTITTCAVLKTDGYTREAPDLDFNLTQYPRLEMRYGPVFRPYDQTWENDNSTYIWHTVYSRPFAGISDYILQVWGNNDGEAWYNNWWQPIPELASSNADSFIFFLSASGVTFVEPVDDPWYSAHRLDNDTEWYMLDRPVNPLACHVQYQYCNPNRARDADGGCSTLDGSIPNQAVTSDPTFWSSEAQQTSAFLFSLIMQGFFSVDISQFVSNLGSSVLLAKNVLAAGQDSGPLPDDQWVYEVQHWHNTLLAWIQRLAVEQATGPSDPVVEPFKQPVDQWNPVVCQPQIIRSNEYTSFSVLGLSIIIGLGTLIILASFLIEPYVTWVHHRTYASLPPSTATPISRSRTRRAEWLTDHKFQLQRLAFEGAGSGPWTGATAMVPTTVTPGERLPRLDVTNHHHPTLKTLGREMSGLAANNASAGGLKGVFSTKPILKRSQPPDTSGTVKLLRLNTATGAPTRPPDPYDEDTGYATSSLGMLTPGPETPRSLPFSPFGAPPRSESWRSAAATEQHREREREHLVRHDSDMPARSGFVYGFGGFGAGGPRSSGIVSSPLTRESPLSREWPASSLAASPVSTREFPLSGREPAAGLVRGGGGGGRLHEEVVPTAPYVDVTRDDGELD